MAQELDILKKALLTESDTDDFKAGQGVMIGPYTSDETKKKYYYKAVVVSVPDGGSVRVRFENGTEETMDRDNASYPKDLNFDF